MIKIVSMLISFLVIIVSSLMAIDLDSLLLKSIGGKKAFTRMSKLNSFVIGGEINFNGAPGTFIEYFKGPNKLYLEIRLSGMVLIQAFDGKIAWQQDHNGRPSKLSGFERQALLTSVYMESSAYLFPERMKGGYNYIGDTMSEGNNYHQVDFYPLFEDTVTVLFDETTGMKTKIIDKMDNITTLTEYSDFRNVSGIIFPYHINIIYQGASLLMAFSVDSITIDTKIDDRIFRMPINQITDFRFNDSNDRVTIPFEYKYDHIWLSAILNGKKKVWFILDSGSSANFFNTKAIADLNLEVTGTMPVMGIAGFDEVQLVRTDSILIGSLTLLNQIAGTMNLADFEKLLVSDKEFGGLLGFDFLSRFPVMIDYRNAELTIFNPKNFTPPAGGKEVPFKLTMLIPTVEAEIDGIRGDFIVDLGNSYGLVLHNQFVEKNRLDTLLQDLKINEGTFGGIGGKLKSKSGIANSFKFEKISLKNVDVIIPSHGEGLAGSSQLAGNIGNQLLNKFKVLFDYDDNKLIFYDNE